MRGRSGREPSRRERAPCSGARALRRALAGRASRSRPAKRFSCACSPTRVAIAGCSPGGAGTAGAQAPRAPRARRAGHVHALRRRRGGHADRAESSSSARRGDASRPLLVLGVRRSGTTLLRVMLDRSAGARDPRRVVLRSRSSPAATAAVDVERFLDDLRADPDAPRLGCVALDDVAARLRPGMTHGRGDRGGLRGLRGAARQAALGRQDADVHAVTSRCSSGSSRTRSYVHLIRDGRDAALSFLADAGGDRHADVGAPATPSGSRASGGREVERAPGARPAGRPGALPRGPLRGARRRSRGRARSDLRVRAGFRSSRRCSTTPARRRLGKPHQQRLAQPPTAGVRDWRDEHVRRGRRARSRRSPATCSRELGYEVEPAAPPAAPRRGSRLGCVPCRTRRLDAAPASLSSDRRSGGGATRRSRSRSAGASRPRNAMRRPFSEK